MAQLEGQFDEELQGDPIIRFAIVADEALIGWCGLFDWDDALSLRLAIAIGDKSYWDRHYGREALSMLLDYAFVHRNANKVWLEVHANNDRAIRSYRSVGFVEEGRIRDNAWLNGQYVDELVMGILRSEWEDIQAPRSPPEGDRGASFNRSEEGKQLVGQSGGAGVEPHNTGVFSEP